MTKGHYKRSWKSPKVPKEVREAMEIHGAYLARTNPQPISDEELLKKLAMIPSEDTRDLTGRLMGDPILNDKRREQCKNMDLANCAEGTD